MCVVQQSYQSVIMCVGLVILPECDHVCCSTTLPESVIMCVGSAILSESAIMCVVRQSYQSVIVCVVQQSYQCDHLCWFSNLTREGDHVCAVNGVHVALTGNGVIGESIPLKRAHK